MSNTLSVRVGLLSACRKERMESALVARSLLGMLRGPREEMDSIIIGWHKAAVANRRTTGGKLKYPMPFHNGDIDMHANDGSCSNTSGIASTLNDAKICQEGMRKVMGVTSYKMSTTIRNAESSNSDTPVVPRIHGLAGKRSNNSLDRRPEVKAALEDHFDTLCKSAIEENGVFYLPEKYKSYPSCYDIFIKGREPCAGGLGGCDGDNPMLAKNHQKRMLSLQTYKNKWKTEYSHLKLFKHRGKAGDEGDGYGDTALKGGDNITGDLGEEEGGGVNAAADGSGEGGGMIMDDAEFAVEYNREVSDSSATPADDGLRRGGNGDVGGANIDIAEADIDHFEGGDCDLDIGGDDIDGEGGGEGGGGGGGSSCGPGGKARGIFDANTDDCVRQVGGGGGRGMTIGTVDAGNDERTCEEVTETASVIGGSEERKGGVIAGKYSTNHDGDSCTLD